MSWWESDTYDGAYAVPSEMDWLAGPRGVALVRVWPNETTSPGWGLKTKDGQLAFMPKYLDRDFNARSVLYGYDRDKWAFAFVMRSLNLVAIDIDGKNGGLDSAKILLAGCPPTLAETSKSGTGFHVFYGTDDSWHPDLGYGVFGDSIGFSPGVDIRGTGCVYHHKQQRWNGRAVAPLPPKLRQLLESKEQRKVAAIAATAAIGDMDELERLIVGEDLISELNKPIPAGKRNNTLFAIGSQMVAAGVQDWDTKVRDRAVQLGLDSAETNKLIGNISSYGQQP